jgi:hypothetical protein
MMVLICSCWSALKSLNNCVRAMMFETESTRPPRSDSLFSKLKKKSALLTYVKA